MTPEMESEVIELLRRLDRRQSRRGYNVPQAAEALSVSEGTVYKLVNARIVRSVKIGSRVIIPLAEIERMLERGAANPGTDLFELGPAREG